MYGLIDNRNGTVYYINAEHPFSVLYRDGRATFIDTETDKRKIGIEVFNSTLKIHIFQLKPVALRGSGAGRLEEFQQFGVALQV
jgi:serine phosphatase RsbU (regulator of sigma subunit)